MGAQVGKGWVWRCLLLGESSEQDSCTDAAKQLLQLQEVSLSQLPAPRRCLAQGGVRVCCRQAAATALLQNTQPASSISSVLGGIWARGVHVCCDGGQLRPPQP